jgi:predicted negative regulator of RcsB-dependent stress response
MKVDLRKALVLMQRGEWQAAHKIVQEDEASAHACWAHGIVHLMEGDLPNARYWYRAAKRDFPKDPSVKDEIAALSACFGSPSGR